MYLSDPVSWLQRCKDESIGDHPSLHLVPRRYFSLARQVARKHKKPASLGQSCWVRSHCRDFIAFLWHLHSLFFRLANKTQRVFPSASRVHKLAGSFRPWPSVSISKTQLFVYGLSCSVTREPKQRRKWGFRTSFQRKPQMQCGSVGLQFGQGSAGIVGKSPFSPFSLSCRGYTYPYHLKPTTSFQRW